MKMKKILSILTVVILTAAMLPCLAAAAPEAALPDIVITGTGTVPATLAEGSDFNLDITFKNISAVDISGVLLDFSLADNVIVRSGGPTVLLPAGTLASGASASITVSLRYIGASGDDKIPIKFMYTYPDSSAKETLTYAYVNAAATSGPGPAPDTSKFKPTLQLTIVGTNVVNAGQATEIRISVQNLSTMFSAYNTIIQAAPGTGSPFISALFAGAGALPEIKPGASVEIKLTVSTDVYAADGGSLMPVSLAYTNIWNDPFVMDTDLTLLVVNPNTPGIIILSNSSTAPAGVSAGSDFSIPLRISNEGSLTVKDIRITIDSLSLETFMLSDGSNSIYIDKLDGRSGTIVTLKLRAGAGLKTGSYPLNFSVEYSDERGNKTADTQQIWIPVTETEKQFADVEIVSVKPSKTTLDPGASLTVQVLIKNNGTTEAKQLKVVASASSAAMYPVSQDTFIIQTLQPGESRTLTFSFQAPDTAPRGSAPVTIDLEVPDGSGNTVKTSQAVSVFQNGSAAPDDPNKNVPKIIVKSYSTDPALVKAGEDFKLSLEYLNTHLTKTIYNIKISFTVTESSSETGNVFTPVDSSNTIYIDSIAPKESVQRDIKLYTIPDAKNKTYTITFSFEYQDKDGNPYTSQEIIGVPVYQPSRFEISEPSYAAETQIGMPVYAYFEMYNLGKNTLYNVKMRVEGAQSDPSSTYYGNFEAGHNEYVELNITPFEVGTTTATVIVSYEDASGEVNEATAVISFNVTDIPQTEPTDGGEPGKDGGGVVPDVGSPGFFQSTLFKIIAGALILVIITVVTVAIIRKRNNRKGIEI
jgi:hypothetical protein